MTDDFPIPPEAPDVPTEYIKALIAHSVAYSRYLAWELTDNHAHGHVPHADNLAMVTGYKFTALMLSETYDLEPPPESL